MALGRGDGRRAPRLHRDAPPSLGQAHRGDDPPVGAERHARSLPHRLGGPDGSERCNTCIGCRVHRACLRDRRPGTAPDHHGADPHHPRRRGPGLPRRERALHRQDAARREVHRASGRGSPRLVRPGPGPCRGP